MQVVDYLLNKGEDWLQYAVRFNLLREQKNDLIDLRNKVLHNNKIKSYLDDVANYHSLLVRNHKDPELPIHKLLFLLDVGLDTSTPQYDYFRLENTI